jgi:hypothetical protein
MGGSASGGYQNTRTTGITPNAEGKYAGERSPDYASRSGTINRTTGILPQRVDDPAGLIQS